MFVLGRAAQERGFCVLDGILDCYPQRPAVDSKICTIFYLGYTGINENGP